MGTLVRVLGFPCLILVLFLVLKYKGVCLYIFPFCLIGVLRPMRAVAASLCGFCRHPRWVLLIFFPFFSIALFTYAFRFFFSLYILILFISLLLDIFLCLFITFFLFLFIFLFILIYLLFIPLCLFSICFCLFFILFTDSRANIICEGFDILICLHVSENILLDRNCEVLEGIFYVNDSN